MAGILLARRASLQSTAAAVVEELTPGWAVGRSYEWPADASEFTLSNFSQTTDAGSPVLVVNPADSFTPATIFTNASDISHARVTVEYRAVPQSPLNIANIAIQPHARYQGGGTDAWRVERAFGSGASWLQPTERIGGFDAPGAEFGGVTNLNNTDQTTYQTVVMDVFNDVVRAKTWFDGDAVPDWLGVPQRFRPTYGYGGSNTPTDDNIPMTGQAGLRVFYGGMIKRITVQELVPARDNLYLNAELDPGLRDSLGRPLFWSWGSEWTSEADGIVEVVDDIVGPDGSTMIPCLRIARTTPGVSGGGPGAHQEFFLTDTPDNAAYTRNRPIPTVGAQFPATVNWSMWIKRTDTANVGGVLTVAQVNYYDNAAGDTGPGSNIGENDYYSEVGPDSGSEDWTRYSGTLTLHHNDLIVRLDRFFGLHDETAVGEILVAGGAWCPRLELP